MARFALELPNDIIRTFEDVSDKVEDIFGAMTRAGAEVVKNEIKSHLPHPDFEPGLRVSRTYKTPTDGGINTKVYISGYFPFSGNRQYFARRGKPGGKVYTTTKGVPRDFVANIFEYGRSGDKPFPKKPFLRKAFAQKAKIEKAMLQAQSDASGGVIKD